MFFESVIDQGETKSQLVDMVQHNRLSHALIFLAKEGSGGLPMALAFASYVMCERAQEEKLQDACGQCAACLKTNKLIHPDLHFSYPVIPRKPGDKPVSTDYISEWRDFIGTLPYGNLFDWLQSINAENKQGNITAEECNDIMRKLNLKTFESRYKVLLMWMPELLGKEGNKLLKLIEEPPANTLFLLVAENDSLILPTILSRCQLVKIPALSDRAIAARLETTSGIPAAQASQIAAISDGNYREAINHLNHSGEDWQSLLRDWLNALLKNGPIALVRWIDEISKMGREKQKQFLRYFGHLLEQSLRIRVLGENSEWARHLPAGEKDFILRINKMASLEQQAAITELLDQYSYYIERNANAKMLFHAISIKLFHILKDKAKVSTW
ncbi:DNA polymerase III subunit [Flavihumibacter petaseus]|uniref:DNA polymerase III subunit delta n=1 Tax=Flavihumibacter petaseus NBRC 106054 TaxID=1220578 RepID=A0A0E9MWF4_9BACT|nr:DNA polymerase III subunit gamma/tau [Flavihumibacter petaseus]GAO41848.1 hypothetical protein FPE01S_01_08630 [Flavihumibacter petaseus NBRC 106054]